MVIEGEGRVLLPSFSDLHIHLDSALTLGRPRYNSSGTLYEGIQIWKDYKTSELTASDFRKRATTVIDWLVSLGITRVRTNIDITEPRLIALREALKLKKEKESMVDLQITAFPQDGILTDDENLELLEKSMELGADNVGLIPHNELTREDGVKSVRVAFDLAEKYGKRVDGHIDETDDEHSRFLEVVAAEAIRRSYQGKVAAGHATALHSYNNAYASKLLRILRRAGVSIISNPVINLNLQGRFDTYPKRRGVTRIRDLLLAGVNVALGEDCIMDPWYPLGFGDIVQSLNAAILADHMTGEEDLSRALDLITYNSAKVFGVSQSYGIEPGKRADLILFDAYSEREVLRRSPSRLFVIKNGTVVARTEPQNAMVFEGASKRKVSYSFSEG